MNLNFNFELNLYHNIVLFHTTFTFKANDQRIQHEFLFPIYANSGIYVVYLEPFPHEQLQVVSKSSTERYQVKEDYYVGLCLILLYFLVSFSMSVSET